MFPSYRNKSADLQSKSTGWFLYDGRLVVKGLNLFLDLTKFSHYYLIGRGCRNILLDFLF